MVPLRLDVCDDRFLPVDGRSQPKLVLKDMTAERPGKISLPSSRRSPFHRLENLLLAAAAAAVFLYFGVTLVLALAHSVQQSYATPALPSVVLISKTVAPGDTLTKLAKRYGDPNIYILAREEQIARASHLAGTAPLVPGQHLRIPVTNPTVIAQIEQRYRHGLVAHR